MIEFRLWSWPQPKIKRFFLSFLINVLCRSIGQNQWTGLWFHTVSTASPTSNEFKRTMRSYLPLPKKKNYIWDGSAFFRLSRRTTEKRELNNNYSFLTSRLWNISWNSPATSSKKYFWLAERSRKKNIHTQIWKGHSIFLLNFNKILIIYSIVLFWSEYHMKP